MRTKLLLVFILFAFVISIKAEIKPDTIRIRLGSPREAVMLHYKYLQQNSYFPRIAAKALYLEGQNIKKGKELAIKLINIFNGRALFITYSTLPTNPDYIDSTTGRSIYYPFANYKDIYLEKIGNKWRYSKETVNSIPEIYQKLYPLDLLSYIEKSPSFLTYKIIFGLEIWQIFALLILVGITYILRQLIRFVVRFFLKMMFSKTRYKDFLDNHLRPTTRTISSIIALSIIFQIVPMLKLQLEIHIFITVLYKIILSILFIILSFRITDYIYARIKEFFAKKGNKLQENLLPFFRTMFKTILVVIGMFGILISLGYDIWPWMAGLSIGGLAVALAAQETIKNIFGSITIIADRPFDVGDWIIYDNFEGTVEEIGIRSTTIRTFYNSIITVPNGKLMDVTIDNMGKRKYRRYKTFIDIVYNTPIELIDAFIKGIKRIINEHPSIRNEGYYVYFNEMSASSLKILLWVWFDVENYNIELRTRHELLNEILEMGRAIGIEFAYPTQTLHIEEFPEKEGIRTDLSISDEKIKSKMEAYFQSKNKTDDN